MSGQRQLRVVVIGPECTGKTTLAEELADHFAVGWVPEFAREFVNRAGRAVRFDDVDAIARGQGAAEDAAGAAAGAQQLLILDTDLVSTCVYSRHYFGHCPAWLEGAARARLSDLYLLLTADVPWIPEGDQRQEPERRVELFELFRATLEDMGAGIVGVSGAWAQRRQIAIAAVGAVLRA